MYCVSITPKFFSFNIIELSNLKDSFSPSLNTFIFNTSVLSLFKYCVNSSKLPNSSILSPTRKPMLSEYSER